MMSFKNFVQEMNSAGDGGVFGGGDSFGHGGSFGNVDFYAPGTAVTPTYLGAYTRRGKIKSERRKRKKSR